MARKKSEEGTVATDNGEPKPPRDKAAKFRELANRRLSKVVQYLKLLVNLGNRKQYEYTETQQQIVLNVVGEMHRKLIAAFTPQPEATPAVQEFV